MATTPPQQQSVSTQSATAAPAYPPITYAWYVVALLMIAYIFSFIDRQILALLVGPIKKDLEISDSQMSYLMGFSFALFYTFFGIPLGRLADSKSRRTIIAIGLVVWSLMSAACGLAQRYWQLLLMRMGVGVGEASLSPAAYSLITDYFPPHRLALAISVYGTGIYIGSGMAYLLGGFVVKFAGTQEHIILPLLGEVRSWQLVFFTVGLPGLLFAIFLYTIREPLRRSALSLNGGPGVSHEPVPITHAISYMRDNWTCFLCHNFGFGLLAFVTYGYSAWVPTFFGRVFGWTPAEAGVWFGVTVMVFGSLGILFGGYLADRLLHHGYRDAKMRVGFFAAVCSIPFGALFPIASSAMVSLALLAAATFILAMPFGVAPAAIQEMMPSSMRGQASAIYLFVVNLIGMGLGPSAVAWFTDYVFQNEAMVGRSLLAVNMIGAISAALLLGFGLAHFRTSIQYLEAWHARAETTASPSLEAAETASAEA